MDICVIRAEGNMYHAKGYKIELVLWKRSVFSRTKNLYMSIEGGGNHNHLQNL